MKSPSHPLGIRWEQPVGSRLFTGVSVDGFPLPLFGTRGLLSAAIWREHDPQARIEFRPDQEDHACRDLHVQFSHAEPAGCPEGSVLQGRVHTHNLSDTPLDLVVEIHTGLRPSSSLSVESLFLPLTALGTLPHPALRQLGPHHQTSSLRAGPAPGETIAAHYLEPLGSQPAVLTTSLPLLIPLMTQLNPQAQTGVSLFGRPDIPWAMIHEGSEQGETSWRMQTRIRLQARQSLEITANLLIHQPDPEAAWRAFHRLCAPAGPEAPAWLRQTKVNYFDFLSAATPGAPRGGGFLADANHFPSFRVGLATQHGYYPHWGDYINPDRPTWRAMPGDVHGGMEHSLDALRDRIALSRRNGARAAIYIHLVGMDDASPLWKSLEAGRRIDADGSSPPFNWRGPDVAGVSRFMSIAQACWRDHLLEQAAWIFELLDPDAIVVDESFGGIGYDYSTGTAAITAPSTISFFQDLRALAKSHGSEKAVLTSDCALSAFVLWADGEAGDHAYDGLLGHEAYVEEPVRYLAALGNKPWLPCAWLWQKFWDRQFELASRSGAGIGLSNGWLDYSGLAGLSPDMREKYTADLASWHEAERHGIRNQA